MFDKKDKIATMTLQFRQATVDDLPLLIQMLADDVLGEQREDNSKPLNPSYIKMLQIITDDPNNELIVVASATNNTIIGMLQLTYIPYLTYKGSWRCLIEGVRVHKDYRGQGLGHHIFKWAIQQAKQKNCAMVQLTSDKQRKEAISFYKDLGFIASHEGFKLHF